MTTWCRACGAMLALAGKNDYRAERADRQYCSRLCGDRYRRRRRLEPVRSLTSDVVRAPTEAEIAAAELADYQRSAHGHAHNLLSLLAGRKS